MLLSAQGMSVAKIAEVTFTSADRVRNVVHNFNADAFEALDNFSPHLTTKNDTRVGDWAAANNVEFACTPTNSSWRNKHAADERLREVVNRANVA